MSKKKVKVRPKTAPEKLQENKGVTSENQEAAPEKPFDFGGLPDRDLKKNLGCG